MRMKTTKDIFLETSGLSKAFFDDIIDIEKFTKKIDEKWFSEEEIIEKISVKDSDGEKILSLDKAVKFLNELTGERE